MKPTRWTTLMVVVLIAMMTVAGVACSSGEPNEPPSITSLLADPDAVAPGAASTVSCVADDLDGDTLGYAWEYTGGYLQGTGSTVTWIAPSVANTYTVTVTVSDGNGGTDEDSVAISVGIVAPTPTPTPTPSPAPSDGSIDIKSNPAGAEVYIDGVDTGSITPYVATHVSAGSHVVKLEYPYYKWRIETVTVVGGETTYINWALAWATSQSVTLQPDAVAGKDSLVYEALPTHIYGTDTYLYSNGAGPGNICRAYIQFDASMIPATAVVDSAYLELYYYSEIGPAAAGLVGVYQVTGVWDEASITWNNQPVAGALPLTTATVPAAHTNTFLFWDMKNLSQGWVDNSIANRGLMLRDTDETTSEGYKVFYSSDWGTANQRPKLTINYYDPAAP